MGTILVGAALWIHIVAGGAAILVGGFALFSVKGGALHRATGRLFVISMYATAGSGGFVGLLRIQTQFVTFLASLLAMYLIWTGHLATGLRSASKRRFEQGAGLAIAALALCLLSLGAYAATRPPHLVLGYSAEPYLFLGTIALWAAILDRRYLVQGEPTQTKVTARHLWRMCFAFFMAVGSLFTGPGATAFPDAVRESGVLSLPEPLVLGTMIFWLVRTRWGRPGRSKSSA